MVVIENTLPLSFLLLAVHHVPLMPVNGTSASKIV